MLKVIFIGLLSFILNGCSNVDVDQYKNQEPKLNLQSYLNGKIRGWGIVQDWKGKVNRRFEFFGDATWQGNVGQFNEKIVYSDGKEETRVWKLNKISDSLYEATTPDVIGIATIKVAGNSMNWRYTMNIKVDDKTYKINFDDWMFLMKDGKLMNRNYFHKFGLTVGELTLFMEKIN